MPKLPKRIRRFISRHIERHREIYKMEEEQSVAVAYQEAREKFPRYRKQLTKIQ